MRQHAIIVDRAIPLGRFTVAQLVFFTRDEVRYSLLLSVRYSMGIPVNRPSLFDGGIWQVV